MKLMSSKKSLYTTITPPPPKRTLSIEIALFARTAFKSMMISTTTATLKSRTKWIWLNPWIETVGWLIPGVQRCKLTFFLQSPCCSGAALRQTRVSIWSTYSIRITSNGLISGKPLNQAKVPSNILGPCWYFWYEYFVLLVSTQGEN